MKRILGCMAAAITLGLSCSAAASAPHRMAEAAAAFQRSPVSDAELAKIRGSGLGVNPEVFRLLVAGQMEPTVRGQAAASGIAMDNWWSFEGATAIAANLVPAIALPVAGGDGAPNPLPSTSIDTGIVTASLPAGGNALGILPGTISTLVPAVPALPAPGSLLN